MRRRSLERICIFLLCIFPSSLYAQEDENIWSFGLDSITVRGYRNNSPLRTDENHAVVWDMRDIGLLPQILGNSDPIHYAQMLPSIQTNNEYRSGINIEGCENQHNMIAIESVPLYNVNHLLGFFSAFNSTHFSSMSIAKNCVSSGSPNVLGGQLDMNHSTEVADSASGILSLGLVSSQGTVRFPLGTRTTLTMSLRDSYINLLYSNWLRTGEQQIRYSFYDANMSIIHRVNKHHTLLLDYYGGRDNASFTEGYYFADMSARWGNNMGAFHWMYEDGGVSARTTAYMTSYRNAFSLEIQDNAFRIPSGITDMGLRHRLAWKAWNVGAEVIFHDIKPQYLSHHGNFNTTDGKAEPMRSSETSVNVNYKHDIVKGLNLSAGLRGCAFRIRNSTYSSLNPSLRLLCSTSRWQVAASYALRHQYLFQTGFSDCGLPTEFWISANKEFKPQYAHEFSLSNTLLLNQGYRLSSDIFYRRLFHQLSYKGSVLDYVNSIYDINSAIMHGEGRCYGFNVMLNKRSGSLTGWISYTFTRSQRIFDERNHASYYPASHERPHELNVVATYELGKHWCFGGTLAYASGTPFTPAESLLLLNNNVIMKYGEYNAARLKDYARLDLSANYKWKSKRGMERGVNLSIYNATSKENELFYYLKTHDDGSFAYCPVSYVLKMLPSLSYYCKF